MSSHIDEDIERKINEIASRLYDQGKDEKAYLLIDRAFEKATSFSQNAARNATHSEPDSNLRDELENACTEAQLILAHTINKYGQDSTAAVALLFWRLGYIQAIFNTMPIFIDKLDNAGKKNFDAQLSNAKRMSGLQNQNQGRAMVRKLAADTATKLWAKDSTESLRIADMCESVWSMLTAFLDMSPERKPFLKYLPDRAKGLREWIKPVAPGYAKRRGRPKKI